MPLSFDDGKIVEALSKHLQHLAEGNPKNQTLVGARRLIREAAFYDFSTYEFLFMPKRLRFPDVEDPGIFPQSDISLEVWIDFETFVKKFNTTIKGTMEWTILQEAAEINDALSGSQLVHQTVKVINSVIRPLAIDGANAFRRGMAPALFEAYEMTIEQEAFILAAKQSVSAWISSRLRERVSGTHFNMSDLREFESASFWQSGVQTIISALQDLDFQPRTRDEYQPEFGEILPSNYAFEPFLPGSINFGLQVIYRQGWIPLGTQSGEIVRTLPLGPKQTEKISAKVIRRTKATRQTEIATAVEAAIEGSASTKDSAEIFQEASETSNWHVETSANASLGGFGGSIDARKGGEKASTSRDTKSTLNDTMVKTSAKIRSDTKVIVTTEAEATDEFSQTSEISNPNDDVAVTYVYSRLQRQYEIYTYLSEVNMVVYVALDIPAPRDLTGAWFRRYDWILSRELLDESFRNDLLVVRNYNAAGRSARQGMDENIKRLMEVYSGENAGGLPDYSKLPGELPDLFKTPQESYERELERHRSWEAEEEKYYRSLARLRTHVFDNILHYCRAIWSAEDSDSRFMRFSQMRVPRIYQAVPTSAFRTPSSEVAITPKMIDVEQDTVPLSDLIGSTGPVGFVGNYAVFYLKQSSRWRTLLQLLTMQLAPYLKPDIQIERRSIDRRVKINVVASASRDGGGHYEIRRSGEGFEIVAKEEGGYVRLADGEYTYESKTLRFRALKVTVENSNLLNEGDSFDVVLRYIPVLEDPELKDIRWSHEPLAAPAESSKFSDEVIARMREYFTGVHEALKRQPDNVTWADLNRSQKNILRGNYHHYLLRERHTRQLVIDTNNLLLTREVDASSTLEPYKEAHRIIDAMSALKDLQAKDYENRRKEMRLDENLLGDPDIEKVTIVAAQEDLVNLAVLDGLNSERKEDDES